MKTANSILVRFLAAGCLTLAGCGGTALLKEARPAGSLAPLAEGRDGRIVASIEAVIVPNREGSWARDAAWDEYLIRIRALSDEPVQIREIAIFDAFDQRIAPGADREELADGTREIERRYVQAGKPKGAACRGSGFPLPSLAGPAVLGVVIVGGIVHLANNAEVDGEIKRRRTPLPLELQRGAEKSVDLFFPVTPLSGRTEVVYSDRHGEHRLLIDTREARLDVDRGETPALLRRRDPAFPDEARRAGISEGYVKARLVLDGQGHVRDVRVIEAVPTNAFIQEARRTFYGWVYSGGRGGCRTVEATLEFKRR